MAEHDPQAPVLPSPAEMVAHLDNRVHGQLRAKQDIAVSIHNHYISQNHRDVESEDQCARGYCDFDLQLLARQAGLRVWQL